MNPMKKMLPLASNRSNTLLCAAGLTGTALALGGFAAINPATAAAPCPKSACCSGDKGEETKATATDAAGSAAMLAVLAQAGTRTGDQQWESESGGQTGTSDDATGNQGGRASTQVFAASLSGLNSEANGGDEANGMAVVVIEDGEITIWLRAEGLAADSEHRAMIYTGDKCPDPERDDRNNDGIVDIMESIPSLGAVLIPIDTNLSEQMAGNPPKANSDGLIRFSQRASYDALLADLQKPDPNPRDPVAKLPQGETLDLTGHVIVVHGVGDAESNAVPGTVKTLLGLPASATIPVACGPLQRVQ